MTKQDEFRQLHEAGCFVMPNPWDVGSAVVLEQMGFKALATTSAGFAWTLARPDNGVRRDEALAHLRQIATAARIPVNADFENAYADDPHGVSVNVKLATATGIAGLSVEDSTGDPGAPLYPFDLAVERIRAARRAIDESGTGVVLTGRSEGFVAGRPDLEETIRRLTAYADAGADCLYAPGIKSRAEIEAVVRAVAPKPVNLLMSATGDLTLADAAAMGVRRISVGAALARAAWSGFMNAARSIAETGRFDHLASSVPGQQLNALFAEGPDRTG